MSDLIELLGRLKWRITAICKPSTCVRKILVAADGLEEISTDQIKSVLARINLTAAQKRDELIRLAKAAGGNDNITVGLIQK